MLQFTITILLQGAVTQAVQADQQDPGKSFISKHPYVSVFVALIPIFGLLITVIKELLPRLVSKVNSRSISNSLGDLFLTREQIERAIRYYVIPDCQNVDPAGGDEPKSLVAVRQNLFEALDEALENPSQYRYLFILADSGMGKTTALLSYFGRHIRWKSHRFDMALIPLGIPDADHRISAIPSKNQT